MRIKCLILHFLDAKSLSELLESFMVNLHKQTLFFVLFLLVLLVLNSQDTLPPTDSNTVIKQLLSLLILLIHNIHMIRRLFAISTLITGNTFLLLQKRDPLTVLHRLMPKTFLLTDSEIFSKEQEKSLLPPVRNLPLFLISITYIEL